MTQKHKTDLEKLFEYADDKCSRALADLKEALKNATSVDDNALYLACWQFVEAVDFSDSLDDAFCMMDDDENSPTPTEDDLKRFDCQLSVFDGETGQTKRLTEEQKEKLLNELRKDVKKDLNSSQDDLASLSELFRKLGDVFDE